MLGFLIAQLLLSFYDFDINISIFYLLRFTPSRKLEQEEKGKKTEEVLL